MRALLFPAIAFVSALAGSTAIGVWRAGAGDATDDAAHVESDTSADAHGNEAGAPPETHGEAGPGAEAAHPAATPTGSASAIAPPSGPAPASSAARTDVPGAGQHAPRSSSDSARADGAPSSVPVALPRLGVDSLPPVSDGRLAKLFSAMSARDAARVLVQMSDTDIAEILGAMSDRKAGELLALLPTERSAAIAKLLNRQTRGSQ